MVLTNEGDVTIACDAYMDHLRGWTEIQTSEGTTNGTFGIPFTGTDLLLKPKSAVDFEVALSTNALAWRCSFTIEAAGTRQRLVHRLVDVQFIRKIPSSVAKVIFSPLALLPEENGERLFKRINSPWLKVFPSVPPAQSTNTPPNG